MKVRSLRTRVGRVALVAIPCLFLAYFFVYPLVSITLLGLTVDGSFGFGVVSEVLTDPTFRSIAWFTLWQAVLSTVLTVLVALPAAWARPAAR